MNTTLTTAAVHAVGVPEAVQLRPVLVVGFAELGVPPSLQVQCREARSLAACAHQVADRLDQIRFTAEGTNA